MGFALFILVNLTLFIRPSEIFPDAEGWPVYLVLILACLFVTFLRIVDRLSAHGLSAEPITLCVFGVWAACILSHLAKMRISDAKDMALEFGKVVIYYLLLVTLVDSPERFRKFLTWLFLSIVVMTALAVLQYHEVIQLPGLQVIYEIENRIDEETGEPVKIPRLCGSGIFNDPNDICLALTLGTVIGLFWLSEKEIGTRRFLCLAPLALFAYTLRLTHSRGGMLGLLLAVVAFSWARFGRRKTLLLAPLVILPALALLASERQASVALEGGDTGQMRLQLWAEGFALFRGSPVFGIGVGEFAEEIGHVAHNSFIQAFTETGFFGGALFAGAFYLALWPLRRLGSAPGTRNDPELERLHPCVVGIVVGYLGGVMSLSRTYVVLTYLILGLAQSYWNMAVARDSLPVPSASASLLTRIMSVGLISLVALYILTRLLVHWG